MKSVVITAMTMLAAAFMFAQNTASTEFSVTALPLPGANGIVMLDYVAYDRATGWLWVPAGNTGSVDVVDTSTDRIQKVDGFAITEVELRGKRRPVGPSSVAIGDGVIYVGNRADSEVCIIDAHTLKPGQCIVFAPKSDGIAAAPDGLIDVAATREVWATSGAPPIGIPAADQSIKIFSASRSNLTLSGKIPLLGSAEVTRSAMYMVVFIRTWRRRARQSPSKCTSEPCWPLGHHVTIQAV